MDQEHPFGGQPGGLAARLRRAADPNWRPTDDEGEEQEGRHCGACGGISPATSTSCIVCGSSLAGPLAYRVAGTTMPALELTLEPGQRVYAQTGRVGWMSDAVQMNTVLAASPWAMFGRMVSGMTPLVSEFSAPERAGLVAFTTRLPGAIRPLEVGLDRSYVLQAGSFLAAQDSVTVSAFFNQNLGAGFFGGEGFILQRLYGSGLAFVQIDGEVVERELAAGETLLAEPGSVAYFESGVGFGIRLVRGIKNILFAEGLFFAELKGAGTVWLQTMPFSTLMASIAAHLPSAGGHAARSAGGAAAAAGLFGALGGALLGGSDKS